MNKWLWYLGWLIGWFIVPFTFVFHPAPAVTVGWQNIKHDAPTGVMNGINVRARRVQRPNAKLPVDDAESIIENEAT